MAAAISTVTGALTGSLLALQIGWAALPVGVGVAVSFRLWYAVVDRTLPTGDHP